MLSEVVHCHPGSLHYQSRQRFCRQSISSLGTAGIPSAPPKLSADIGPRNFHLNCDYFGTVLRCLAAQVLWLLKRLLPWAFSCPWSNLSNFASKHPKMPTTLKDANFSDLLLCQFPSWWTKGFWKEKQREPLLLARCWFQTYFEFWCPFFDVEDSNFDIFRSWVGSTTSFEWQLRLYVQQSCWHAVFWLSRTRSSPDANLQQSQSTNK